MSKRDIALIVAIVAGLSGHYIIAIIAIIYMFNCSYNSRKIIP